MYFFPCGREPEEVGQARAGRGRPAARACARLRPRGRGRLRAHGIRHRATCERRRPAAALGRRHDPVDRRRIRERLVRALAGRLARTAGLRLRRRRDHRPQRQAARARGWHRRPAPARQRPHQGNGVQRRLHPVLEPGPAVAVGQPLSALEQSLRRGLGLPERRREGREHDVPRPPARVELHAGVRGGLLPPPPRGGRSRSVGRGVRAVRRRPRAAPRRHPAQRHLAHAARVVVRVLGRQPLLPEPRVPAEPRDGRTRVEPPDRHAVGGAAGDARSGHQPAEHLRGDGQGPGRRLRDLDQGVLRLGKPRGAG